MTARGCEVCGQPTPGGRPYCSTACRLVTEPTPSIGPSTVSEQTQSAPGGTPKVVGK